MSDPCYLFVGGDESDIKTFIINHITYFDMCMYISEPKGGNLGFSFIEILALSRVIAGRTPADFLLADFPTLPKF